MLKTNNDGYLVASVKEAYKGYKNHPSRKQELVDYRTFKKVLEFMFSRIWFYMITKLWIFKPPHRFGEFYVAELMNTNGFYKNWELTNKKGSLVEDYNLHTNGRKYFTRWNKRFARVTNQYGYRFIAFRGNKEDVSGKRGLAGWIKKCSTDTTLKDYRAHII